MLQSLEAEETLLGLAVSDSLCAERVVELPEDTFSFPETVNLFKVIRKLSLEHKQLDMTTVGLALGGDNPVEMGVLMECCRLAISPAMYQTYETQCLDLKRRRNLSFACSKVIQKVGDLAEDAEEMAAELQTALNDNGGKPMSQDMETMLTDFVMKLDQPSDAIYTGVAGLDRLTGGLKKGMLAILGARPGVGKTALALSIASYVASKSGPVLLVSLEMNSEEILTRLVAAYTGVDAWRISSRKIQDEEWDNIWGQSVEIGKLPIRLTMESTPMRIRREAGAMLRNGGLKMIVVDYIQLMRADSPCKSRYEEVSQISRELKLLAMEIGVPILALTQFNRESEAGGVKRRPTMAEAKDSGSIEQDANIFLIQYAPGEPKPDSKHFPYWQSCKDRGTEYQILEIAKNRSGPVGEIPIEFNKPLMRFTTLTEG